ncbi:MAG: ATP-dependent Clp protease proteolytic subunit, partial [Mariprofundaceae bacterium]|nr:ATP-dependent Clp protease proteolytic subunit [Mariprofundaceae bacterium]
GFQGQATDIEIHAKEIIKLKQRLNEMMAQHTGQPLEKVSDDVERDYFLTAQEACDYGLIDKVLTRRPDNDSTPPEAASGGAHVGE